MLDKPHPNAPGDRQVPKKLLQLIPWNEIRLSAGPRYLVKGILPHGGLIVVYGPPKCGKTFWLFDILMHVVLGWEYRGRRVHQGSIVYCLFEGQANFPARVEAFRQRHLAESTDDVPFFLMPHKLELIKDHKRLIEAIKLASNGHAPVVVGLDTLNRSFTGSESSDESMTAYVAACDAIREALNCAVVIVHHSGLTDGRARGHTALLGAADAQIGVKKDLTGRVVATVEYMKDGEDGEEITSKLEMVEIGLDEDGEPMRSCVVTEAETVTSGPAQPKLSANQRTMFAILHEAGSGGLSTEDWYERCREAGLGVKRRADLTDFRMALKGKGLIYQGMNGWSVKQPPAGDLFHKGE